MANDDQPRPAASAADTLVHPRHAGEQLDRRDAVVGAAHAVQVSDLGSPGLQVAAKVVGVADAVKITAGLAHEKDVRSRDSVSGAASVTMATGAGGPAVQTVVAGVSAVDASERALNTLRARLNEIDPSDVAERRAIEARNEGLSLAPREFMTKKAVRELVREDIASLHRIDDPREIHSAAVAMGSNAHNHGSYKEELARQDPHSSEVVKLAYAKEQQSIAAQEDRKRDELSTAGTKPQLNTIERVSARAVETAHKQQALARTGDTPLEERFNVVTRLARGRDYEFRDQSGKVAFKERWASMTSTVDSPAIVKAIIDRADERGWKGVRVSGSQEFRRQAWIAASARGIKAAGYEPTEGDRYVAREEAVRLAKTRVEPQQQVREATQKASKQPQSVKEAVSASAPSSERATTERATAERVHIGRVVAHGHDHFDFDKTKERSFYVKLAGPTGEKVIWGVDLDRAIKESQVKVGDEVRLQNRGAQPVTIPIKDRDEAGRVTGSHDELVKRNTWEVTRVEHSRDERAARPVGHAIIFEALEQSFKQRDVPESQRDALRNLARKELDARVSNGQDIRVAIYDPAASRQAQRSPPSPYIQRPEHERSR